MQEDSCRHDYVMLITICGNEFPITHASSVGEIMNVTFLSILIRVIRQTVTAALC